MANSNNQPDFGPFQPNPPGIFDVAPEAEKTANGSGKKSGKKVRAKKTSGRKPRAASATVQTTVAPTGKRPRKARQVKVELGLALSALAGLTEDDSKFVTGVVQAMGAFPVKQKRRIVNALGRLFV
jgi:hypothetical protein